MCKTMAFIKDQGFLSKTRGVATKFGSGLGVNSNLGYFLANLQFPRGVVFINCTAFYIIIC